MGAKLKTEYGTINLSKNIFYQIIRDSVADTKGMARFGNTRLFLPFLVNDESNCMKLDFDDDNVYIEVFLIVRFGVSISRIADEVMENIQKECITNFGTKPARTKVNITGVESKNKTIRRSIEFTREG